jgi:hypothetical protein
VLDIAGPVAAEAERLLWGNVEALRATVEGQVVIALPEAVAEYVEGASGQHPQRLDALFVLSPVIESTISQPQGDAKGNHAEQTVGVVATPIDPLARINHGHGVIEHDPTDKKSAQNPEECSTEQIRHGQGTGSCHLLTLPIGR